MDSKGLYLPPTGWVRRDVVLAHVPFGTTKLDQEIRAGRFPAPQAFGPRIVAWNAAAVHAWINCQAAAPAPAREQVAA